MKRFGKEKAFLFVALFLATASPGVSVSLADLRQEPIPEIAAAWDKLDAARTYRADFAPGFAKDHASTIEDYVNGSIDDYPGFTPQVLLLDVLQDFADFVDDPDPIVADDARRGLQESLNEIMAGQALVGNQSLIDGLRARFPSGVPPDSTQLFDLNQSVLAFQLAVDTAVAELRRDPGNLRKGMVNQTGFPFYVQNTDSYTTNGESVGGEIVENELYRLTDVVDRLAEASNSVGKRLFFFGNVTDEDNYPTGNFPGPEDLDINADGIQNAAGRDEAASAFKRSAQATYLHSAALAAVQSRNEFDWNNGYVLKRRISDADQIFQDILAGFNPLNLVGDYVPFVPVNSLYSLCTDAIFDAQESEGAAANAARTYDTDETALRSELRNQQVQFVDRIEALTGLTQTSEPCSTEACQLENFGSLLLPDERDALFAAAELQALAGQGELGQQLLRIASAELSVKRALETVRQAPARIRIEEERNANVAYVRKKNGKRFAALTFSDAVITAMIASANRDGGLSFKASAGLGAVLGAIRGAKDILSATQAIQIEGINTAAKIKSILLEQAINAIAVESARNSVAQEEARYEALLTELQRIVRAYVASQEDFAEAYFVNPAYRLTRDLTVRAAEQSFESAMEECYVAAKALEYAWSERYNNPVSRIDGLLPEPLPPVADPFVRAESVFAAKYARDQFPDSLEDFADALKQWDAKMRQLRPLSSQQATAVISLRRDILLQDEDDFRNFIDESRVSGNNPDNDDLLFEFGLQIDDQTLFPFHPNIKIETLRVNLVSSDSQSIAGPGTTAEPANVELIMLEQSRSRTFFANLDPNAPEGAGDDVISYELQEGRTLSQSPFLASVDATIDGYANPMALPSVQLGTHSPASPRWTLRMQMDRRNNRYLRLENLKDIEITVGYVYGKPPTIF